MLAYVVNPAAAGALVAVTLGDLIQVAACAEGLALRGGNCYAILAVQQDDFLLAGLLFGFAFAVLIGIAACS